MDADLSCITSWAVKFVKTKRTNIQLVRDYERKFRQLSKENFDLRQLSIETQDRLSMQEKQIQTFSLQVVEKEQIVQALRLQIAEIENTKAWKLAAIIRKTRIWLIPNDSHREYLAKKVWRGIKNGKSHEN